MQYINLAFTILFILVLSLVSMFFYGIGVDDTGYLEHWNNVLPLSEYIFSDNKLSEIGLEWFYLVLFSFFKLFTNDISIFKFFNTFVSLSILAYSYYKITHRYYFILLLYILIYLFIDVYINQYRSGLASSFGVLAIVLLSEGKIKSSLLWLLVGALIHNSQFWLVVVYICILFPNIRKFLVFVLVILVFIPGKADVILSILKYFDLIYIRDGNVYLLTDIKFSTDIISHILRKIISYAHKSTKLDSISLFSFVISKTIIIYIYSLKYKLNIVFLCTYFFAILLFYVFIDFDTLSIRILRHALFIEPIMVYCILKKNTNWIFFMIPVLLFNAITKNLPHIENILLK